MNKLIHVVITPEGAVNVRFWKSKNGKCSEKVFDSLLELVRIVRAADQKGEIEMTWADMAKKYPEYREDMTKDRERDFVKDCFDCYEKEGLRKI